MRKPSKYQSGPMTVGPRKVAITLVIISAVLVVINLVAYLIFCDEAVAHRQMESMAREYYEDYLYDSWTVEALSDAAKEGIEVNLRLLLTYDAAKNINYENLFTRNDCDGINTYASIFPEEPYGKHDYRLELEYSCHF